MTEYKILSNGSTKIALLAILVIVVLGAGIYYFISKNKTIILKNDLKGKSFSELFNSNLPIECNVIGFLDEVRAKNKKEKIASVATTKIFLKNGKIRDEGISVWTDGKETPALNIILIKEKKYFSLLLDGSSKMASLDFRSFDSMGSASGAILESYKESLTADRLDCRVSSFGENIFVPENVCYIYPPGQKPRCPINEN